MYFFVWSLLRRRIINKNFFSDNTARIHRQRINIFAVNISGKNKFNIRFLSLKLFWELPRARYNKMRINAFVAVGWRLAKMAPIQRIIYTFK